MNLNYNQLYTDFLKEVDVELKHLKKHATKEEISNLNLKKFSSYLRDRCIYGQMTGECDSSRAKELYVKSYCKLPYNEIFNTESLPNFDTGNHFTALERYICFIDRKQTCKIMEYLKGTIDNIDLNFDRHL